MLPGNGDGTFGPHSESAAGAPNGICTGDLNRDGKPDVTTANLSAHKVSVLLNSIP